MMLNHSWKVYIHTPSCTKLLEILVSKKVILERETKIINRNSIQYIPRHILPCQPCGKIFHLFHRRASSKNIVSPVIFLHVHEKGKKKEEISTSERVSSKFLLIFILPNTNIDELRRVNINTYAQTLTGYIIDTQRAKRSPTWRDPILSRPLLMKNIKIHLKPKSTYGERFGVRNFDFPEICRTWFVSMNPFLFFPLFFSSIYEISPTHTHTHMRVESENLEV